MKNLIDLEAFKLDKVQMNEVVGGISREEYCKAIEANANAHDKETWSPEEWDSWAYAYDLHCIQGK